MKPPFKKNKILIIIVGVLVVLSLNFFQKEVRWFFYSISSPVQSTFWLTSNQVVNLFETIWELRILKERNEELELKTRELMAENSFLKTVKQENEFLRTALQIGLEKEFQLTLAQIVGKDINQDSILINRGVKDGLAKDMPVITQEKVLLGKISEVYENSSRINLISHQKSSLDATIIDTDIAGVIRGKGNFQIYLDFISQDQETKPGQVVVSNALGGIYPKGLLVGLIKEIKRNDLSPFYGAELTPFFDLKKTENILVILNFK